MSATLDLGTAPALASRHEPAAVKRLKTKGIEKQIDAFKLEGSIHHTRLVKTRHLKVTT